MKNSRGQALVEFVLILPLFIYIVLVVIDFGRIFNAKNNLENDSMDIIEMFKNGSTISQINEIYPDNSIDIDESNVNYYKFNISTEVDIMAPGLGKLLGDPYIVKTERIVYHA